MFFQILKLTLDQGCVLRYSPVEYIFESLNGIQDFGEIGKQVLEKNEIFRINWESWEASVHSIPGLSTLPFFCFGVPVSSWVWYWIPRLISVRARTFILFLSTLQSCVFLCKCQVCFLWQILAFDFAVDAQVVCRFNFLVLHLLVMQWCFLFGLT